MSSIMSASVVLITGAAGFIGARFVESCRKRNLSVVSADELSFFNSRPEHRGLDFGEKVDRRHLLEWLRRETPVLSQIVHLGARTDTTEMDRALLKEANLDFSKDLWNYAADARVPFVYASSAATYGDGSSGYDDEEALIPGLKPLNPYGDSKQEFDLWALAEEQRAHAPPAWSGFKFFNVYGFGERHKGKMASVVLHAYDQILERGRVRLFKSHKAGIKDGHQKRDFIYVGDVIEVLHFACRKPVARGIFNLGTGEARTFLDLARAVFHELKKPEQIDFIDTPAEIRERYQYFTQAKMDRLRSEGYRAPFTPLERGISLTLEDLSRPPAFA
jgi:ADP-L-glycero-D-manno-heptose 6-epimerase